MNDARIDLVNPGRDESDGGGFDRAVARARGEFIEMPGLRLNAAQAARLWSCDATVSDAVLSTPTATPIPP
jgi:hypothetical protein